MTEVAQPDPPATSGPLLVMLPAFNDWAAVGPLLGQLDAALQSAGLHANVLIVDDASARPAADELALPALAALRRIDVLRLRRNLGHQRAIAIGLAYIADKVPCEAVVLMDSDGEDNPADVPRLLAKYRQEHGEKIIFAERTRRSESLVFRVFYKLYCWLHYVLIGERVRVGNFSVIPARCVASLAVVSEMWNHYSAAAFKSRQPFDMIPTQRAHRLAGRSKMNFVGLVAHGLSAVSVYSEIVGVRLLVLTCGLIGVALVGLGYVVGAKLFTDSAIPGWATYMASVLVMILLQATLFSLIFSFVILGGRQASAFLPLRDYRYFISSIGELPTTTLAS